MLEILLQSSNTSRKELCFDCATFFSRFWNTDKMFQNDIICDFLVESVTTRNLSAIPKNWKGIAKPITIQQKVTILEGHQQGRLDLELQVRDPVLDQGLGLQEGEERSVIDHPQGMGCKLDWLNIALFIYSKRQSNCNIPTSSFFYISKGLEAQRLSKNPLFLQKEIRQ